MAGDVGERLGDHEVGRALHRGGRPLGHVDVEHDGDRRAGDHRRQSGVEAPVLEDDGVDASHQVADLAEGGLRLLVGLGDEGLAPLGIGLQALPGMAEVHRQGDEALLGAVVEVPLDPAPLGFGRVDRSHPP